jgi:hypothetical protein
MQKDWIRQGKAAWFGPGPLEDGTQPVACLLPFVQRLASVVWLV